MADVDGLLVRIEANTAQLRMELQRGERALSQTTGRMESLISRIDGRFAALGSNLKQVFGGIAAGALMRSIVQTNIEFEKLQAQLKTVTGSAAAADQAFRALEDFATRTPFQLSEVVDAFIRLRGAGLQPTLQMMEDFGNLAAARSKSFEQVVEAVNDAAMGEFERLKEFSIKMSAEGDKITASFGGASRTIKRDGQSIVEFIQQVSRENFGDAMAEQAATLGGAFSNLQDQVDALARAIGEGGLNAELTALIRSFTEAGEKGQSWAAQLGNLMGEELRKLRKEIEAIVGAIEWLQNLPSRLRKRAEDSTAQGMASIIEELALRDKFGAGSEGINIAGERADLEAQLHQMMEFMRAQAFSRLEPRPQEVPTLPASPSAPSSGSGAGKGKTKKTRGRTVDDFVEDLEFRRLSAMRGEKWTRVEEALRQAREIAEQNNTKLLPEMESNIRAIVLATRDWERANEAVEASFERATELAEQEREAREAASERAREIIADRQRLHQSLVDEAERIHEIQALNALSEEQRRTEIKLLEIRDRFRAAGIPLTEQEVAGYRALAATLAENERQVNLLKDGFVQFGDLASSAFEDAIINGESLREVLHGLMTDLARIGIRSSFNMLFSTLGNALFGGAMALGSAGAVHGAANIMGGGGTFGGVGNGPAFRDGGGPVQAGVPYMIGTGAQPELFVPSTDGFMVPRQQLGGVTYAPQIAVDARHSRLSAAEMHGIVETAVQRSLAEVQGLAGQGGSFAKAVGRR